jgi:hypothetical protein
MSGGLDSYSYLPVRDAEGRWRLVSDEAVARFLRSGVEGVRERRRRLALPLRDAIAEGLAVDETRCLAPNEQVSRILSEGPCSKLMLVVRNSPEQDLLGVVSPFDLL